MTEKDRWGHLGGRDPECPQGPGVAHRVTSELASERNCHARGSSTDLAEGSDPWAKEAGACVCQHWKARWAHFPSTPPHAGAGPQEEKQFNQSLLADEWQEWRQNPGLPTLSPIHFPLHHLIVYGVRKRGEREGHGFPLIRFQFSRLLSLSGKPVQERTHSLTPTQRSGGGHSPSPPQSGPQ